MMIVAGLFIFVFGAIVGSFLNVVILRLPAGEGLGGRSHCPNCLRTLKVYDLVPLVSFLLLGRKCRGCSLPISWRYFMVELLTGLLFFTNFLLVRPDSVLDSLVLVKYCLAVSGLLVIFAIDWEHYVILDRVLVWFGVLLLAANLALDMAFGQPVFSLASHTGGGLAAGILAAVPFFLLWYGSGGKWMGFGDVKFMPVFGLILGFPVTFVGIFLAFFIGAFISVGLVAFYKKTMQTQVPFGTFLSVAGVVALWYGQHLLNWYLALLGL